MAIEIVRNADILKMLAGDQMDKNQKLGLTVFACVIGGIIGVVMLPYTREWQTLITGVLSLGAAIAAAYLLNKQIRQAENLELRRDKRKFLVARASLPLALSQICDFCMRNSEQLKAAYLHRGERSAMPAIDVVPIPDNVLTSIQMMIETTPHENVADRLAEILSMIQIAQARMRDCTSIGFRGIVNFRENLGSYLIDFGAIYAITSSLFVYSRNKISFDSEFNMQPLHYNKILDSFLSFDMHSAAYDELKDQVRGMAEAEITANSL